MSAHDGAGRHETAMDKAAMVEPLVEPAEAVEAIEKEGVMVEPVVEPAGMAETIDEDEGASDEERRPGPVGSGPVGIVPIGVVRCGIRGFGIRRRVHHLWCALRGGRRLLCDLPTAVRLLAGLPNRLARLAGDYHRGGKFTAGSILRRLGLRRASAWLGDKSRDRSQPKRAQDTHDGLHLWLSQLPTSGSISRSDHGDLNRRFPARTRQGAGPTRLAPERRSRRN